MARDINKYFLLLSQEHILYLSLNAFYQSPERVPSFFVEEQNLSLFHALKIIVTIQRFLQVLPQFHR